MDEGGEVKKRSNKHGKEAAWLADFSSYARWSG